MRAKLAAQFPGKNRWDLKYAPGGLIDLEFLAQTLQLDAAPAAPAVLDTGTVAALQKLERAGIIGGDDAHALIEAAQLENDLLQVLRIALDAPLDPDTATPGLKMLLARAGGAGDFDTLEAALFAAQGQVRALYDKLMGVA